MIYFPGCASFMIIIMFVIFFRSPVMADDYNPLIELVTTDELARLAGYGEEKLSTVVVSGELLCVDGRRSRRIRNSPFESHPIPGASVAVWCQHRNKKTSNWHRVRGGKTDEYGEFLIDLPSHLHAIPNIEKRCHVRITRVPKKSPCHRAAATGKADHKHYTARIELIPSSGINGIRTYSTRKIRLTRNSHLFTGRKAYTYFT